MPKLPLAFLLPLPLAHAHLGEEAEQHSLAEVMLGSPLYLAAGAAIFLALAYLSYRRFPLLQKNLPAFLAATAIITALFAYAIFLPLAAPAQEKPYHTHADFKVYINGQQLNFSQQKYMTDKNNTINPMVHLHDLDGDVIHHHAPNITLAYFFSTLNMGFNSTCFATGDGAEFCSDEGKELQMFVLHEGGQWGQNAGFGSYVFSDLDRILITFGNETIGALQGQMDSITDKSCIQSGTCPERGAPTDADCAGDYCVGVPAS